MLPAKDIDRTLGRAVSSRLLSNVARRLGRPAAFFIFFLSLGFPYSSYAQCLFAPSYTVDLTGQPSGTWSVSSTRSGWCCLNSNCVEFNVTLDSDAAGLKMTITGGSGSTYYKINCTPFFGNGYLSGSQVCLSGTGPYAVTVCKPGGNAQTYAIESIPMPHAPYGTLYAKQGCTAILTAKGFDESSITWTAVDPSNNSFLSCTTACDTTNVSISPSFPAYADFVVYGPAASSCLSGTFYDTVRVYYVAADAGNDTTICASSNFVNLNGSIQGQGGTTSQWVNGSGIFIPNDTVLNSTYIPSPAEVTAGYVDLVLKTDSLDGCGPDYDTMHITIDNTPQPIVTGNNIVCASDSSIYTTQSVGGYTYQWTVLGGVIASGQGTHEILVDWDAAGPGFVYVKVTNSLGCEAVASITPIVQYDLNKSDLKSAATGPNASSVSSYAVSTGEGVMLTSCGASDGLDLTVPGSTLNYGRMAMLFRFQREEDHVKFFERGGVLFEMASGVLRVQLQVKDSAGSVSTIGPLNTGYTVPNDDQLRDYVIVYDSLSGELNLYIDGSSQWAYTVGARNSLDWTNAGNATFGATMGGNCSPNTILDMANISRPITIRPAPQPAISGMDTVCENIGTIIYQTASNSGSTYAWAISGGTITTSTNSNSIEVDWGNTGAGTLTVTEISSNGCATEDTYDITIVSKPALLPIIHN